MKLGFDESQSTYTSGSQSARTWTEAWVKMWAYCPHCGNAKRCRSFPNNSPLADFLCSSCNEEFELKSQKSKFGAKVAGWCLQGPNASVLAASNNPNLLLMNYDLKSLSVLNLFIVPETLLHPRYHRRTQAAGGNRAPRRLDRLEHPDRQNPRGRQNSHRSERRYSFERSGSSRMAEDALSQKRVYRGSRLATRCHEVRKVSGQARIHAR